MLGLNCSMHACVPSHFSHVQLFATPQAVARQAPPSMGFPRQEHWSGLPFPPPGDLPDPGIEPCPYVSCIGSRLLTTSAFWEAYRIFSCSMRELAPWAEPRTHALGVHWENRVLDTVPPRKCSQHRDFKRKRRKTVLAPNKLNLVLASASHTLIQDSQC